MYLIDKGRRIHVKIETDLPNLESEDYQLHYRLNQKKECELYLTIGPDVKRIPVSSIKNDYYFSKRYET